jgi:hypothetical protein
VITLVLTVVSFFLLSLIFIFKSQALLLEELDGGSEPLTRSKALVLARFWPILGFTLLLQVGRYLVSLGWGLLLQLPLRMLQGVAWHGEALHIASLLEVLPRVLTLPVVTIGMTLLYFDTRMRQEGLDLTARPPTE